MAVNTRANLATFSEGLRIYSGFVLFQELKVTTEHFIECDEDVLILPSVEKRKR